MSTFSSIVVRAASTQTEVDNHQCDIVQEFDSLKEAKDRIKYWLSKDYLRFNPEITRPIQYAQLWVSEGEEEYLHSDFYAKGYNGEPQEVEA